MGASHTARCLLFPFVSRPVTTIYKYRFNLDTDDDKNSKDGTCMPRCSSYGSNLSLITPPTVRRSKDDGLYVEWKTNFEDSLENKTPQRRRRFDMTEAVAGQTTPKGFPGFTDAVKARETCTPFKGKEYRKQLEHDKCNADFNHHHNHSRPPHQNRRRHHLQHHHHEQQPETWPVDQAQQTSKSPNIQQKEPKKVRRRLSWRLPIVFNASASTSPSAISKRTKPKKSKLNSSKDDGQLIQNSKVKLKYEQRKLQQQQQQQQPQKQQQLQQEEKHQCCNCKQNPVRKIKKLNKATQTSPIPELAFAPMPVYGLPFAPLYVYETPMDIVPYSSSNGIQQQNHIKDLEAYCVFKLGKLLANAEAATPGVSEEWGSGWTGTNFLVEIEETASAPAIHTAVFSTGNENINETLNITTAMNGTNIGHGPKIIVRTEEVLIVGLVLLLWVGAIMLFFNRWGKIRMLEPYQPKFQQQHRSSCPLVDMDSLQAHQPLFSQRASVSRMSMGLVNNIKMMPTCQFSAYNPSIYAKGYHSPYARPRQNSVFVGPTPNQFLMPRPPRKTRSAMDLHSMVLDESAEAV